MSVSQSPILIVDGSTGQVCEAVLFDKITEEHLSDFESRWRPWLANALTGNPKLDRPQTLHWDWRLKVQDIGSLLGFPSFAIKCAGETQGLMIVNTMESCRLNGQKGKPLVYVEFLETAPWNRKELTERARFRRVGPALLDVAIQASKYEGFEGRIGLHSLPQSDGWYREVCGMSDLGQDPRKLNLRYFEMTNQQATTFLGKGN